MRLRMVILLIAALAVLSACNLGSDNNEQPIDNPTTGPITGGKPTVTIISPQSGSEVVAGETVFVSVNATDSVGINRIQLLANNQIVKTVSSDVISGDKSKSALLDYTPRTAGSVTLQVVAYRGSTASDPAQLQLTVRSSQTQVTVTAIQAPNVPDINPNDPTCRVLVNAGLNFRSGPGTNYDIVTVLTPGTVLPIVGRLGDNSWWQLRSGLTLGWVSSQFTTTYGICSSVPVVVPPASPTPRGGVPTNTPTRTPTSTNVPPVPTATSTPGRPDLVVTSITGPATLTIPAGQTSVTQLYSVAITNTGSGPTQQFLNSIVIVGSPEVDLGTVANLNAGESINLTINLTFNAAGTYTIRARADKDAQVTEISEVNNTGDISVTVN
jgi:uncharacterized protein YraI